MNNSLSKAPVEFRFNRQRLTKAEPQAGPTDQTGCGLLTHKSQDQVGVRQTEAEAGLRIQKQEGVFKIVA